MEFLYCTAMKKIASVDMDDTLINTHQYYTNAIEEYIDYMSENFGFDRDIVKKTRKDIDQSLVHKYGLSPERFPQSFVNATKELLQNEYEVQNIDKHIQKSRSIGLSAYRTPEEYQQNGFRDGAERMLKLLSEDYDELHLLTAGYPETQDDKIEALNLDDIFDSIHIVEMHTKGDVLRKLKEQNDVDEVVHIGNSEDSDVQGALDAEVRAVYLPNAQWRNTTEQDYDQHNDVLVFNTIEEYNKYLSNEG